MIHHRFPGLLKKKGMIFDLFDDANSKWIHLDKPLQEFSSPVSFKLHFVTFEVEARGIWRRFLIREDITSLELCKTVVSSLKSDATDGWCLINADSLSIIDGKTLLWSLKSRKLILSAIPIAVDLCLETEPAIFYRVFIKLDSVIDSHFEFFCNTLGISKIMEITFNDGRKGNET